MQRQSQHPAKTHNLPLQSTPFIGRTNEVAEITDLLADPACRLLTLVGPGGVGKTRLAIEMATTKGGDFANGIYFVPLQPVYSPDFLVSTIADAVKFPLSGQDDPSIQLLNYLRGKEMLLVLDNFEQLLIPQDNKQSGGGTDLLPAILAAAPALKLLVTSREVLNLQEEWLYPVEGMEFPASVDTPNLETYSAVQLFAENTRRIRRDFSLADEQADVVRICQFVEGTPLAIELAAAWTKTLRCAEVATEIQRNLDFLTTSLRNVPERHRSMQAVFNHSWKLLTAEERDVFKRLSVFRGGFQREAAEQVAGAGLPTLSALVDKSLLRRESDGRYQIHELLRQYAEEKLAEVSSQALDAHELHCAYFADFLQARLDDVQAVRTREVSLEIQAELENVRAAWQWAVEGAKVEEIQKSAGTYFYFCQMNSRYLEGADALEAAARSLEDCEPGQQRDLTLAQIFDRQGWLCIRLGQLGKAKDVLEQSLAIYQSLDVPPVSAMGSDPRTPLGVLAMVSGDYKEAARLGEQVRQASEARDDQWNLMFSHYVLANASLAQGEFQAAQQHAQQAYYIAKAIDSRWFMTYILNDMGRIDRALGDYAQAKQHYQASYAIREALDDPEGMAVALNHLGEIAILQKDYAEAEKLYQQSLAIYREIGDRGGLATALNGLGGVAFVLGNVREARGYFYQALQTATEIQFVPLILSILISISELLLQTGQGEKSVELLVLTIQHPASDQETQNRARKLLTRGEAQLPPEIFINAVDRGEAGNFESVVVSLYAELAASEEYPDAAQPALSPHLDPSVQPLLEPLTPRELEVLRLIASGLSNPEIAAELIIAVGTVKAMTHNIYGKLGTNNRVRAVSRATDLNLL